MNKHEYLKNKWALRCAYAKQALGTIDLIHLLGSDPNAYRSIRLTSNKAQIDCQLAQMKYEMYVNSVDTSISHDE